MMRIRCKLVTNMINRDNKDVCGKYVKQCSTISFADSVSLYSVVYFVRTVLLNHLATIVWQSKGSDLAALKQICYDLLSTNKDYCCKMCKQLDMISEKLLSHIFIKSI